MSIEQKKISLPGKPAATIYEGIRQSLERRGWLTSGIPIAGRTIAPQPTFQPEGGVITLAFPMDVAIRFAATPETLDSTFEYPDFLGLMNPAAITQAWALCEEFIDEVRASLDG